MTAAAAPQAGEQASGAASVLAAPPPVPGVRRRAAGDPRGQLEELQRKIRGLEGDNRQLREQLQHSRARVEELDGQVGSLHMDLQQCQEERSRCQQLEAERQQLEAKRQRLEAKRQQLEAKRQQLEAERQRRQELKEIRESAWYREERLGAAQAKLQEVSEALSQSEAEDSELRALVAAQEEHLHNLEMERRRLENRLQDLQVKKCILGMAHANKK